MNIICGVWLWYDSYLGKKKTTPNRWHSESCIHTTKWTPQTIPRIVPINAVRPNPCETNRKESLWASLLYQIHQFHVSPYRMRLKLWILTPMIKIQLCLNTLKERRHKLWYHTGGRHCVSRTNCHSQKCVGGRRDASRSDDASKSKSNQDDVSVVCHFIYIKVIQHLRLEMFAVCSACFLSLEVVDDADDVINHQVPVGCKVTKN